MGINSWRNDPVKLAEHERREAAKHPLVDLLEGVGLLALLLLLLIFWLH